MDNRKGSMKAAGLILTFTILMVLSIVISISEGTLSFRLWEIINTFGRQENSAMAYQIIHNIRLPRVLTGTLVGMNLGVAGALLQGVLRNPLASPQIIGINAGAGLMAVLIMIVFPGLIHLLPLGAFLGAMVAAVMIYSLALKEGIGTTTNIVLAGIAISALLNAFTMALMIINSDQIEITYSWLIGGLNGRGWFYYNMLWPYSLIGIALAVFLSPKINLFILGDEVGSSLGLAVKFYRLVIILTGALLAGSAVSAAGTIGFVGLIAPHLARLLIGNDYRYLLIMSAIIGALLLVTADTLARIIFQPVELPVGILTAALGAPFFFFLMYKKTNTTEV